MNISIRHSVNKLRSEFNKKYPFEPTKSLICLNCLIHINSLIEQPVGHLKGKPWIPEGF